MWSDISAYVDDENGDPMEPIAMRLKKRAPLLTLLKDQRDSYWWIDVMCARSNDFPFELLGNIYACCTRCIAMIDCDDNVIPEMNAMWDADSDFQKESHVDKPLAEYLKQYEKLNHLIVSLTRCMWWTRVWMWQETVLPQDVRLISETTTNVSSDNMLHVDELYHFEAMLGKMLHFFMGKGKEN